MSSLESKKSLFKISNNNIPQVNESSTMETLQEMNPKFDIEDSIYDQFIEQLTITKFKEFSFYCKEKEIENLRHDMKIKKSVFIQIMKNVFPGRNDFFPLFEQLFNRFKLLKCKIIYNQKSDNYFISNIYSNDEIDIFEISCALACFIKCFFFEKIKILFDLADVDEDGFINGSEVKKMIYTLNYIFCREENNINIESNVVLLSLASIKAKKSFDLIMRHPGNLSYVIQEEKYINFNHFVNAVKRVYNYKYSLMPLFISLKYSLNLNRNEKELEIKKNNLNDYSKISSDIVSIYKKIGDIGKSNFDFKKNLEQEKVEKKRKFKQINAANQIIKSQNISNNTTNISKFNKKLKINNSLFQQTKDENNRYIINYNRICGLEAYPGKLKIKEKGNTVAFNSKRLSKFQQYSKSTNNHDLKKSNISPGYMTTVEILEEISYLIYKQKK